MNPPFLLGWIGVPEALIVLLVLPVSLLLTILWIWMLIKCIQRLMAGDQGQIPWLVAMLVTNGLGAAVYWLFVHRGYQPPPPPPPPTTISSGPAVCPHCRKPLTTLSVQGICPECMLQAGLGTQGPDPSESKFTPPAIDQLAPHFPQLELLELLGRGGMGAVYKARQKELNRLVALKVLPSEKAERDPAFAERFAREARALASLSHPNIVTVFDYGQAGGHCYLLMEYVDGLSLRQLLQRGTMKPEEAVAIVPRICEALQFAHQHGIVHRDIKPENILVDTQGRVKIADFGIAKIIGAETERTNLTEPRQTIGTPHYMAPEQVEKPSTVDHRADIYSLGVVFYEMLTGELPLGKFASPSQKVQVDVRLDEIVLRALEKEPARRYQQASQVKTAVESMSSKPSATGPASIIPSRPNSPNKPLWSLGLFLAFTVTCVVSFIAVGVGVLSPKTYQATARMTFAVENKPYFWNAPNDNRHLDILLKHHIESVETLDLVITRLDLQSVWSKRYSDGEHLPVSMIRKYLKSSIEVSFEKNSDVFGISAFSESKDEAAKVANALANSLQLPDQLGTAKLFERAEVPFKPVRPNLWINLGIGLVLGATMGGLLGGLVMFVLNRRRLSSPGNRAVGAK
jgi:serine/threonine protein kinase